MVYNHPTSFNREEYRLDNFKATTIICVTRNNMTALVGDGQVTFGNTVIKSNVKKVRRLYKDQIICGFAGSTADAFTLFDRFEKKLEQYSGNLTRSAVELAKDWRSDRYLRKLEAMMIVASNDNSYLVSGTGDIIEPEDSILAIGSGAPYAQAAAKALVANTELSAIEIAKKSLHIAGEICIYTNTNMVEEILTK